MYRVGYQGEQFSQSYLAAKRLCAAMGWDTAEYTLIPCRIPSRVISMINNREIEYGVLAIQNSVSGIFRDTYDAIRSAQLTFETSDVFTTKHALYSAKLNILPNQIKKIYSHSHALLECAKKIKTNFPHARPHVFDDSAAAARYLTELAFKDDSATVCTREAGEHYGLFPVMDNLEDDAQNHTEFRMYSNKDYSHMKKTKTIKKIFIILYSKAWRRYSVEMLLSIMFGGLFYVGTTFSVAMNEMIRVAIAIVAAIITFLSQQHLERVAFNTMITGRWKYFPMIEDYSRLNEAELKCIVPRLVRIDQQGGELYIVGKHADDPENPVFEGPLHTVHELDNKVGDVIFEYAHLHSPSDSSDFSGIAKLSWKVGEIGADIYQMQGQYWGHKKKILGTMKFYRISSAEYHKIENANYLSKYRRN
jgi:prephenate dehydratase